MGSKEAGQSSVLSLQNEMNYKNSPVRLYFYTIMLWLADNDCKDFVTEVSFTWILAGIKSFYLFTGTVLDTHRI